MPQIPQIQFTLRAVRRAMPITSESWRNYLKQTRKQASKNKTQKGKEGKQTNKPANDQTTKQQPNQQPNEHTNNQIMRRCVDIFDFDSGGLEVYFMFRVSVFLQTCRLTFLSHGNSKQHVSRRGFCSFCSSLGSLG